MEMRKKWFACPVCNQKLLMIDPSKKIEGVYIKCKKCKQEVEVYNEKPKPESEPIAKAI